MYLTVINQLEKWKEAKAFPKAEIETQQYKAKSQLEKCQKLNC
jgi:hypothetical protein